MKIKITEIHKADAYYISKERIVGKVYTVKEEDIRKWSFMDFYLRRGSVVKMI